MKEIWQKNKTLEHFICRQAVRPEISYKWSRYIFPVRLEDRLFLFNLFTKQCVEYDGDFDEKEVFESEKIEADASLRELLFDSFLVPEFRDECSYYESVLKLVRATSVRNGYNLYTIIPTTACNARCVYCFEEGMKQVAMTDEVVVKTIEFILATRRKDEEIRLSWFGGEPLLGERVIDSICAALTEHEVMFHSTMITNGSLLTENLVEKMKKRWRINHIQVSMDGAESDYIARKRYLLNQDQYRKVLRGVELLSSRNIRTAIRCNVDGENIERIDQFFHDLTEATFNRKSIAVYLAPLYQVLAGGRSAEIWKRCLDLRDQIAQKGFSYANLSRCFTFRSVVCMADNPRGSIVIAPDGALFNCDHCVPGTEVGNLDEGVVNKELFDASVFPDPVREKCRLCPCLPECTPFRRCPIVLNNCCEVVKEIVTRDVKHALMLKNREDKSDEEKVRIC